MSGLASCPRLVEKVADGAIGSRRARNDVFGYQRCALDASAADYARRVHLTLKMIQKWLT